MKSSLWWGLWCVLLAAGCGLFGDDGRSKLSGTDMADLAGIPADLASGADLVGVAEPDLANAVSPDLHDDPDLASTIVPDLIVVPDLVVVAPPTVTSVTLPRNGPEGGMPVVIKGTNFSGATAVTIDGVAVQSFTVDSATQITAVPAPHAPVPIDGVPLVVSNSGGASNNDVLFYYVAWNGEIDADHYVTVADDATLESPSFTLEARFLPFFPSNLKDYTHAYAIVKGDPATDSGYGIEFFKANPTDIAANVRARVAAPTPLECHTIGGLTMSPATGHQALHYALSYDATAGILRLYIEGAVACEATHAPGALATTDDPLHFGGAHPGDAQVYAGRIDEVRFRSEATAAAFTPESPPTVTPTTQGLWHFNEGYGATYLFDASPQHHDGAITGSLFHYWSEDL